MAEGYFKSSEVKRALHDRSSPPSSSGCSSIQTQPSPDLPPRNDQQLEEHGKSSPTEVSPPPSFEELFIPRQIPVAPLPLGAAFVPRPTPKSNVVRQGYLRKLETKHRRYFVLREGSHTGPSWLEWYKNREKFIVLEKSAGTVSLLGSSKQGVIYLQCCLGVSQISKKGLTVALCAKNKTMMLVMEDQWEQKKWYIAIKKLMEEERDEERAEDFDEESDCYCTLPPGDFFVVFLSIPIISLVHHHEIQRSGVFQIPGRGVRFCFSATDITLAKVFDCAHARGGSADGGGTVNATRLQSPSTYRHSHNLPPALVALRRSRPKSNNKFVHVTPLPTPLLPVSRDLGHSQILTSSSRHPVEPCKQDQPEPSSPLRPLGSRQSSTLETKNYVERKIDHRPVIKVTDDDVGGIAMVTGDHHSVPAKRMEEWESGEERSDYMIISS
ncbi:hypothetical protein LDENG_00193070 [Lucifuga dentata]|nr:hypothetical protein LDENG_00193070 [Lucifuga dentata]